MFNLFKSIPQQSIRWTPALPANGKWVGARKQAILDRKLGSYAHRRTFPPICTVLVRCRALLSRFFLPWDRYYSQL